jgi:D-alanyl-D-alanine carboxypeptidase
VIEHPQKIWNPATILGKYYEYQTNEKAKFPPGKDFNYSDVNYVLLAMIIEQVTGETYHEQLRSRIFDKLGMDNSYLEYYEEPRGDKPFSHAFFSTMDLVTDVNTSFEWGGGGIVSTCEELNIFFRALVDGRLFIKESTSKRMLTEAEKGRGGMDYDYGLGIMKRSIHGLAFYGHGGAYDCDVFYCPERNISICMSLNQMETHGKRDKFLFRVIELIM